MGSVDLGMAYSRSEISGLLADSSWENANGAFWMSRMFTAFWWLHGIESLVLKWLASGKLVIQFIKVAFLDIEQNFKKIGRMANSCQDLMVLRKLGVKPRAAPPPTFINVYWWPPPNQWIKVNTDGSALGAPGKIAAGGVFRDKFSWVRGCFHIKGGIGFAFEAELLAVISAIQIAFYKNWRYLWIESDSTYIVNLLHSRSLNVPWRFAARWREVLVLLSEFNLHITHIFREGNKVADILAADNVQEGWWPMEIDAIYQESC
ncbi:uncharacterized protein LOC131008487 [Salvia miltiorrhiza]|uniref:uncharacterized protein LOC131008487 n=1 Tax=Salvia miltiorrhiza TaxID=226208 RepID=UPI0025ABDA90|nr:uncharacterized protein LOC131008487 [Salvia miltiorrhiza]